MCGINSYAFAEAEDRATLGSDPSAVSDFKEGGYPRTDWLIALWKTKAINPFGNFFQKSRSSFHLFATATSVDWLMEGLTAGFSRYGY